MKTTFRWLAATVLSVAAVGAAQAQGYPNKPVRVIVPYPAGGTTDIIARVAAQQLSERLKQPFVVENKAGANGAIGSVEVARAPADGYTLLMGTASTHGINSAVYKSLPYDAVKDFAPVTIVADLPPRRDAVRFAAGPRCETPCARSVSSPPPPASSSVCFRPAPGPIIGSRKANRCSSRARWRRTSRPTSA